MTAASCLMCTSDEWVSAPNFHVAMCLFQEGSLVSPLTTTTSTMCLWVKVKRPWLNKCLTWQRRMAIGSYCRYIRTVL